jgi:hypothetical protein
MRLTLPFVVACHLFVTLILPLAANAEDVPLWGRWEAAFQAAMAVERPADVAFSIELTTPSGKRLQTQGFWDGDRTWRVRYLPKEEGTWKFATRSQPAVEGLAEHSGEFNCRKQDAAANVLQKRGPIRVASSQTHFEHADGTPYFWLGDTVWNGPLLATKDDWDTFLDDRFKKQFNVIQFNMLAPWRTTHVDELGQTGYTFDGQQLTINAKFFQRMDERVNAINDKGLVAVPVLLWTLGRKEVSPGQLPDEACIKLARYMVARYQGHHVSWILAGDENFQGERGQRWARIGREVFGDSEHAPATLHPQGMQWHFDPLRRERWLDFIGYQSGHGDDARTLAWIHSGPPARSWQNEPIKPILNMEPPYEAHVAYQSQQPHTDYTVRRACYWSLMNTPVAGLTYGGHGIWSWQTEPGVPQDHGRSGVAQPWHVAKDLPAAGQMQHLRELFTAFDWTKLRPAQDVLAGQPGGDDPAKFVSACRTEDGRQSLLYLPVGGSAVIADKRLAKAGGEWFDPRTGKRQPAVVDEAGAFTAPDQRDWVLVLAAE